MATAHKAFRTRAFDATKPMYIYYGHELPDLLENATGNRQVTQMPTGMEKEEEMESHLQEAIIAQQASTSGVQVENHIIPTPKVHAIESNRYQKIYSSIRGRQNEPLVPSSSNINANCKHYIKFNAWQSLDREEPDYDVDSEDEAWLSERPHIDSRTLEKIFDVLEAQSSDNNICLPAVARNVLTAFDETVVDDVYDYWLTKRTSATTSYGNVGVGGLIPRVRTECRKDAQGSINPYVAFRRRAEKMQTRKNRKNEEDGYEKILKMSHDFRRALTLFEMVRRREKTKAVLIDMEVGLLEKRMELTDWDSVCYNEFVAKMRSEDEVANGNQPLSQINGNTEQINEETKKKKKNRRVRPTMMALDREVPSKAWLKMNAEVWNQLPMAFNHMGHSPVVEVERSAQAAQDANLDGRYAFKRRRGCSYRAALSVFPLNNPQPARLPEQAPIHRQVFETFLPNVNGVMRSIGMARKRLGRGGRVIFDRVIRHQNPTKQPPQNELRVPKVFDPFDEEIVENPGRTFKARLHPFAQKLAEETEEKSPSERFFKRSDFYRFNDDDAEKQWIASYRPPTPKKDQDELPTAPTEPPDVDEPMDVDPNEHPSMPDDVGMKTPDEKPSLSATASSPPPPSATPPTPPPSLKQDPTSPSDDPPTTVAIDSFKSSPCSGNGSAGRVEPTPVPAKMCGTVLASDEWRAGSGSPSESNSSTEWGAHITYMSAGEDEARTGEHPVAREPPSMKDSIGGVTIMDCTNAYILAPPSVGS